MQYFWKNYSFRKFVLSCLARNNLAKKTKLVGVEFVRGLPKPILSTVGPRRPHKVHEGEVIGTYAGVNAPIRALIQLGNWKGQGI